MLKLLHAPAERRVGGLGGDRDNTGGMGEGRGRGADEGAVPDCSHHHLE